MANTRNAGNDRERKGPSRKSQGNQKHERLSSQDKGLGSGHEVQHSRSESSQRLGTKGNQPGNMGTKSSQSRNREDDNTQRTQQRRENSQRVDQEDMDLENEDYSDEETRGRHRSDNNPNDRNER